MRSILFMSVLLLLTLACQGENPDAWENLNKEALELATEGKYDAAVKKSKEAIVAVKEVYGKKHPKVAITINNLAKIFLLQKNYPYAEMQFARALNMAEEEVGAWDAARSESMRELAILYQGQGRPDESLLLLTKALELDQKNIEGNNDVQIVHDLMALIDVFSVRGQFEEAEKFARRAIALQQKKVSASDPTLAILYNKLAIVMSKERKFGEAESFFKLAMKIWQSKFGNEYFELGILYNNLAFVEKERKNFVSAEKYFKQALEVHSAKLGKRHEATQKIARSLSLLYRNLGKTEQAAELEERYFIPAPPQS